MSPSTESTHLTLDVAEGDPLKLSWRTPVGDESSYHVQLQVLKRASTTVRTRLQDLITSAIARRTAKEPLRLGLELKELAKAGYGLRRAIFTSIAGNPDEEEANRTESEWLPNLSN